MTAITADGASAHGTANAELVARLERLPVAPDPQPRHVTPH